jgi:hypothetical protein
VCDLLKDRCSVFNWSPRPPQVPYNMPLGVGMGLQLSRLEADGVRSKRAAVALRPTSRGQHEGAPSSDTVRKARAIGGYRLVGAVSLVLGIWLGVAFFYSAPKQSIAMYKRSAASMQACEAAGVEIARLRHATSFIDDCSTPVVTPLFGSEGQVIVSRTVQGDADDDDNGRVTYSVKMDGRGVDTWRALQVRRAPSELTLDASLLPTGRSAVPASAQR